MKQIYIETQAKDQVHQNFRSTNSEVHCLLIRVPPNSDFLNIFLIQNKGKGPPGDILHPDHPPDGEAVLKASSQVIQCHPELVSGSFQDPNFIDVRPRNKFGVTNSDFNQILNTEIQRFNKNQYSNFLQTLNFTNMKKQILFLAFFVLVGLASVTTAFGQTSLGQYITSTQPIIQLNCVATSEALHPFPGTSYTYTMAGDPAAAEQPDEWTWFATKDPNFISTDAAGVTTLNLASALQVGTGELMAATNYLIPSTTNNVQITWSPEVLAGTVYQGAAGEPTFVVGFAKGTNCADNIQVYEINPRFNFIVDIANIDPIAGTTLNWDDLTEQCVDVVRGASYDGTSKELTMDYGTNTLYFEVSAANFILDWTPTFQIVAGLADAQTAVISLHTTLADAQTAANAGFATHTWSATDIGAAGADWATGEALNATNPDEIVTGVSVFVRVVITNSTYESLTDNPFTLAVDAIDNAGAGQWDMEDEDCVGATATDVADQADEATHTINPRPTITRNGTTDAGAPNPTVTIPKTPYNPAGF